MFEFSAVGKWTDKNQWSDCDDNASEIVIIIVITGRGIFLNLMVEHPDFFDSIFRNKHFWKLEKSWGFFSHEVQSYKIE